MRKRTKRRILTKNILAIDVGGSHVKVMTSRLRKKREFLSGSQLSAKAMVKKVKDLTKDWSYDVISLGYPGPVFRNRPIAEPHNLGHGWAGFDFAKAFRRPTRVVNDALMQALGSYKGGRMLFLGLGTGLGSSLFTDGRLCPGLELAHHPWKKQTYEDYVGRRGLDRFGKKRWNKFVEEVIDQTEKLFNWDHLYIGGGNTKKIEFPLPKNVTIVSNREGILGGVALWRK